MIRVARRALILVAVMLCCLQYASPPAGATGAGMLTGQGTTSPGLTTVPTNQSWTLTSIVAAGADIVPAAGSYSCSFSGGSTAPETVLTGSGTGSGSCNGSITTSCSVTYLAVGSESIWSGTCVGGSHLLWHCTKIHTSINPAVSYIVFCQTVF
jgi:hypothetical protein